MAVRCALAALAAALGLAAVAAAATPLTAAQYRARANAICRLDAKRAQGAGHTGNLVAAIQAQLQLEQTSYTQLRQLAPPAGLRPLHAQVLAGIRAGIAILQTLLSQAQAGTLTQAEFQSNPQLTQNTSAEDALWRKLGATACATS